MLQTFHDNSRKGITVPYPPLFKGLRRNHGFMDLRGRPDLVEKVPEAMQSHALRNLLVQLAQPDSPVFSLGSDLGEHQEGKKKGARYVAGGYLQVMKNAYATTTGEHYLGLSHAVSSIVEGKSTQHNWVLRYECTPVAFNLDRYSGIVRSLWTWFFAQAHTQDAAIESREELIGTLGRALFESARRPHESEDLPFDGAAPGA